MKASNNVRPFVVDLCVKEIERRGERLLNGQPFDVNHALYPLGLDIEGLYRVSGSVEEIELLKARFESDWEQTELYLNSFEDIHVITGALKLYFRSLPIPLITFDSYPSFISAISEKNNNLTNH